MQKLIIFWTRKEAGMHSSVQYPIVQFISMKIYNSCFLRTDLKFCLLIAIISKMIYVEFFNVALKFEFFYLTLTVGPVVNNLSL